MTDEFEKPDSAANYYFMVWRERGTADRFAFVEKEHWDKTHYLNSATTKNFTDLLPDDEEYGFFTSSEMIYTYNKKKKLTRGKTPEARQKLLDAGFMEVECPFGD